LPLKVTVCLSVLSEYNFKLITNSEVVMSEELIPKVKQMIIDSLRIEGMSPDEIETDAPLFGEGLGLDSIDALQLVVAMEKQFGVVVPDAATGAKVFASVRSMADHIAENAK
jgi:acyl carrier protein